MHYEKYFLLLLNEHDLISTDNKIHQDVTGSMRCREPSSAGAKVDGGGAQGCDPGTDRSCGGSAGDRSAYGKSEEEEDPETEEAEDAIKLKDGLLYGSNYYDNYDRL